jgi:hypothetical protein
MTVRVMSYTRHVQIYLILHVCTHSCLQGEEDSGRVYLQTSDQVPQASRSTDVQYLMNMMICVFLHW